MDAGGPAGRAIVDFDIEGNDPGAFDLSLVTDPTGISDPANVWHEAPKVLPDYFVRLDAAPACDADGNLLDDLSSPSLTTAGADVATVTAGVDSGSAQRAEGFR